VTATPPEIVLYSRPGCHLCEETHAMLVAILGDRASHGLPAPSVTERNIEADDDRRYMFVIPVVAAGGREIELATSPRKLGRFLAEVLDGVAPEPAA
jgi:hypothetical protein